MTPMNPSAASKGSSGAGEPIGTSGGHPVDGGAGHSDAPKADAARPQEPEARAFRIQAPEAGAARSQASEADSSRPKAPEADGCRPQASEADASRPQAPEGDASRPQPTARSGAASGANSPNSANSPRSASSPAGADSPSGAKSPAGANSSGGARRHFIIGTAGHIDHGKTSLVRALTGTDPDRLPEERRRGMTIELGFAELSVGDIRFGVVDVPGHERFVRTMVSGATGIDIAVLIVAADDSVMPQTVEHLEILRLLGVRRMVVALTKADAVDGEMVELVAEEIGELLQSTPFSGAAICPVSSITGVGLERLKETLAAVAGTIPVEGTAGPFRMAIDRVFSVPGRGTVVTGSALSGWVRAGDTLELLPAGASVRVRDLQTHGSQHAELRRGQRSALNLGGVDREKVGRGMELAAPGYLPVSRRIDVRMDCLASYGRALKSGATVRLEIGTMEAAVRVALLEGGTLEPGESSYAQLRSGQSVVSSYGQRFIVRDENATRTIGGGTVLRPAARRRRRTVDAERQALERLEKGTPEERVEEALRDCGFAEITDLRLCAHTGVLPEALGGIREALARSGALRRVGAAETFVASAVVDDLCDRLTAWLQRFHEQNPGAPGRSVDSVLGWLERHTSRALARALLDEAVGRGVVKPFGAFACLPAFAPKLSSAEEKAYANLIRAIREGGFQPPTLEELAGSAAGELKRLERLATLAVASGEMVRIVGTIYLHRESERRLRETVARLISTAGDVAVSQVRSELNSSRKFVVPFLEYLDRIGYTERVGDQRRLAGGYA